MKKHEKHNAPLGVSLGGISFPGQTSDAPKGVFYWNVKPRKPLPPVDLLRRLLRYEPETGKMYWNKRTREDHPNDHRRRIFNTRFAGKEAFACTDSKGYRIGMLFNRGLLAHRLIWKLVHGTEPGPYLDHIDGDPANNRSENLRECTNGENMQNAKTPRHNTSGAKGVSWNKRNQKWRARFSHQGKEPHIGYFNTLEEATEAVRSAREQHHGKFTKH